MISAEVIEEGQSVKRNPRKLRDVVNLLKKHLGDSWRDSESLQYYKEIIDKHAILEENTDRANEDEEEGLFIQDEELSLLSV
ncbi:hypothetical protein PR048_010090 [Dryococelus australis]|uniref:Uncharacterized protein n=1 Tax=Dryococelus australis TaxID=614101 RepID=A0ABQ9I1R1_9NEOP|nr:hypothetical protein PR048_010090 [Dryococelus australis]